MLVPGNGSYPAYLIGVNRADLAAHQECESDTGLSRLAKARTR